MGRDPAQTATCTVFRDYSHTLRVNPHTYPRVYFYHKSPCKKNETTRTHYFPRTRAATKRGFEPYYYLIAKFCKNPLWRLISDLTALKKLYCQYIGLLSTTGTSKLPLLFRTDLHGTTMCRWQSRESSEYLVFRSWLAKENKNCPYRIRW